MRLIIAEFSPDVALLSLRLQSTRWCEAVKAAIVQVGLLTVIRAALCPGVAGVDEPNAEACGIVVRAAIAQSHYSRTLDLADFHHLRMAE